MKRIVKVVLAIALFAILAVLMNIIVTGLAALFGVIAFIMSSLWTIAVWMMMLYIGFKVCGLIVEIVIFKKLMSK